MSSPVPSSCKGGLLIVGTRNIFGNIFRKTRKKIRVAAASSKIWRPFLATKTTKIHVSELQYVNCLPCDTSLSAPSLLVKVLFCRSVFFSSPILLSFLLPPSHSSLSLNTATNCEAQGKGRAKGRPRKVTQRSFIDGGWWISFP